MIQASPLRLHENPGTARLPGPERRPVVEAADPAIAAMHDFRHVPAVAIPDITPIDGALAYMSYAGTRWLFARDAAEHLAGMVTAADIQGDKPLRHLQALQCTFESCSREDVLVRDVMVPVAAWRTLRWEDVHRATVGQIAATFATAGRECLIVLETAAGGAENIVRGLFSLRGLEKQLGQPIEVICPATSFAQIERVLAHGHGECH